LRLGLPRVQPLWIIRGFLLIPLALGYFALSPAPNAFGVVPAPDGGYPGFNTAEGQSALLHLTTGTANTAVGWVSLENVTTASFNTGVGAGTLVLNSGDQNTATGAAALLLNTTGANNTANGALALLNNTEGSFNTASGANALNSNTTGVRNTANGYGALLLNTTGSFNTALGEGTLLANTADQNTATGAAALLLNTTGSFNTANGASALQSNTTGGNNTASGANALASNTAGAGNTASGFQALSNNTGSFNIGLGNQAGVNLTTGDRNIDIGNGGVAGESSTIRIGNVQTAAYIVGISGQTATGGAAVFVASDGKLGTVTSSRRFKKDIADMNAASEVLLALRPVTFHYRPEIDKAGIPQYGLVAEEVAEVNPDLVVRDEKGEIYTVRYEAVNAMLLNEFLKEHREVQEQKATITQLNSRLAKQEAVIAQQQKGMEAVTARLDEQASQIQKVSAQLAAASPSLGGLELSKFAVGRIGRCGPAPQMAQNNH
jgi:uncharacterized coiled-coil protein SlyX